MSIDPGLDVRWNYGAVSLLRLEAEYGALRQRSGNATVFNDWPWLATAARGLVPSGRDVAVLDVRREGRLVACVPLTRGLEFIHGMPACTLRFLGFPLADRVGLVMDPDEPRLPEALLDAIVGPRSAIADVAILGELARTDGQAARLIGAASGRRRRFLLRHCSHTPVLDVVRGDALRASYAKSLRTRLSRARRRLNDCGPVRYERLRPAGADVPRVLAAIAAVEDESWKGQQGKGIFSTPQRRSFFEAFSRLLADAGRLEVSLLWIADDLAAYCYGFREGRTFYEYNSAYRPKWKDFSVGRILFDEMLGSAHDSGLDRVDASRGSLNRAHLLADWTDTFIDHEELWLFTERWWSDILALMICEAKPVAKRIMAKVKRT